MLTIDFIRHTSLQISPDLCYGQTDVEVRESFEEEAREVRRNLAQKHYDAIFYSPLRRAAQLCEACGMMAQATCEPRVMERNFGEWELRPWEELYKLIEQHPDPAAYHDEYGEIVPPMGESKMDMLLRIHHFITECRLARYRRIAVFCHGGVINCARYLQHQIEAHQIFTEVPPYGSITTLRYAYLDEAHRIK